MGSFIYYVSTFLGFLYPSPSYPKSAYVIYEWYLSCRITKWRWGAGTSRGDRSPALLARTTKNGLLWSESWKNFKKSIQFEFIYYIHQLGITSRTSQWVCKTGLWAWILDRTNQHSLIVALIESPWWKMLCYLRLYIIYYG